jgi:hypothetical protein
MKCQNCHKTFRDAYNLRRHQSRTSPCEVKVEIHEASISCQYCDKHFTSKQSLNRHIRQICKKDENSEFSTDISEQPSAEIISGLQAQIEELTSLLKIQAGPTVSNTSNITKNTTNITINTLNQLNQNNAVNIYPWDGARCINIDFKMIQEVFAENVKLREYTSMGEYGMATPLTARPYVTELFMELIKRAHAEPAGGNIYLSPNRADQVLVLNKHSQWEVIPFSEATKILLDDVTSWMKLAVLSHEMLKTLPMEAQSALACAGMHYEYEPEEYLKLIKTPMAAHLTNCRNRAPKPGTQVIATDSTLKPPPRRSNTIVPLGPAMLRSSYDPPIAYIPRYPDLSAKPRLDEERAAKLFMRMRPSSPITVDYIKNLAKAAEEDVDYLIKKLWEATEEEYLKGEDAGIALRVIAKYDEDHSLYD